MGGWYKAAVSVVKRRTFVVLPPVEGRRRGDRNGGTVARAADLRANFSQGVPNVATRVAERGARALPAFFKPAGRSCRDATSGAKGGLRCRSGLLVIGPGARWLA